MWRACKATMKEIQVSVAKSVEYYMRTTVFEQASRMSDDDVSKEVAAIQKCERKVLVEKLNPNNDSYSDLAKPVGRMSKVALPSGGIRVRYEPVRIEDENAMKERESKIQQLESTSWEELKTSHTTPPFWARYVQVERKMQIEYQFTRTPREKMTELFPWYVEVAAILRWIWKTEASYDSLDVTKDKSRQIPGFSISYRVLAWRIARVFDYIKRHAVPEREPNSSIYSPVYYRSNHMAILEYFLATSKPEHIALAIYHLATDVVMTGNKKDDNCSIASVNRRLGRRPMDTYYKRKMELLDGVFRLGVKSMLSATLADLKHVNRTIGVDGKKMHWNLSVLIKSRYPMLVANNPNIGLEPIRCG